MKKAFFIFSLLFVSSVFTCFAKNQEFELTTKIQKQERVSVNQLRLHLQLKFTNRGKSPIALYKHAGFIVETIVKQKGLNGKKREVQRLHINGGIYPSSGASPFRDADEYVLIKPSQSFWREEIVIIIPNKDRNDFLRIQKDINYELQIKVQTWFGDESDEKFLRDSLKWRILKSELLSRPMSFKLTD